MIQTTLGKNNLDVKIAAGDHTLMADVSEKLGGHNTAMNPHELLEASLGACTSITVSMYARHKKWPLSDIKVKVDVVKEGEQNVINREIEFLGDLTPEQKTRLEEVANKCPIHKLLHATITIETRVL